MKINVFISIGKVKSQQHLDFDISGGNIDPRLWSTGAGAPPGASGPYVRVVGTGSPILAALPPGSSTD